MIKQLKQFTVNLMAGANVATVLLMLLVGYSDRISPAEHPLLSSIGMTFPAFLLANLLFLFFWLTFKWRMAWIPIAGFFLSYVPISIYMPLNRPGDTERHAEGGVLQRLHLWRQLQVRDGFDRYLDYLKEQDADIVCLQEDVDSWRGYFFREYAKVYPYNDTTVFCKNSQTMNGLGIHSRYPILKKERIEYESVGNGSVAYYLKVGADTLLVINNHLEGTTCRKKTDRQLQGYAQGQHGARHGEAESMFLVDKLGRCVGQACPAGRGRPPLYRAHHSQYPIIVCGDFNDTPISYTRHTIAEGLTDCFSKSGTVSVCHIIRKVLISVLTIFYAPITTSR